MFRSKRILSQILIFLAICSVTIIVNIRFSGINNEVDSHEIQIVSDEWQCELNGSKWGLVDINEARFPMLNEGDMLVFSSALPESFILHPVLRVYSIHSVVSVYIDNELIYEYGLEAHNQNKLIGYGYHYIPMLEEYAGKPLRIEFGVTENNAFSTIEEPIIASADYVHRDFMIENRYQTGIILFIMLFGIVAVVVSGLYIVNRRNMLPLTFAGLFAICIGMWSLCNTNIIMMFTYDLQKKTFFEFGTLYLAPTFLFAYFYEEINRESKVRKIIYYTLLFAQVMFSTVAWGCQLLGIVRFPSFLKGCHVLMVLMILFLVIRFLVDLFKGNSRDNVLSYGFECLAIFAACDLLRFNVSKFVSVIANDHYISLVHIGVLIFVISLIFDFGTKYIRNLKEIIEIGAYEKLAYADYLTGLNNRRYIEELMDDIDKSGNKYAIIEYDLNDLKHVNDTLGHDEGDKYIKEFAMAISSTFEKIGTSGRCGGDEFVTIILDYENINVSELLQNLDNRIESINSCNPEWNMSTAYGVAYCDEEGINSIRDASKLADTRMYNRKIEMKASR